MRFDPELLILYDYNENEMYFLELELKKIRNANPRSIIQMIIDFKDLTNELNYD